MEWSICIEKSIEYIENNLENNITVLDVANHVYISPFFLQRGFSIIVGYGIGEYIRNRRLFQAALDLKNNDIKVVEVALKYCYESHESFTKAFTRFHGVTPLQVKNGALFKKFYPIKVKINIQGVEDMDYKIVELFQFKIIGFEKKFNYENSYQEIPKFWDELCEKYANNVYQGNEPRNAYEKAIVDYCIGEYAVCVDDLGDKEFRYIVGGKYTGGDIPEGMTVYECRRGSWAIFECIGPNPQTLQSINTKIFNEWLPNNQEYQLDGNSNVEWYDCMTDMNDPKYHSQIWIPVKKK